MNFNLLVIKLRISSTCYTTALKTCYVKKITCSPMSGVLCNAIITRPHAAISTEKEMLKNRGNVIIITKKITSNIIRLNNSGDEVDEIIQAHQLSLR